eukprot:CAMPEP_0179439302 /NCGR_PEP_ID=MMETSP0799-20121207/22942_1 /TAXON_ID=46947 /ORGANISM="Geminigera cryophila, Strain CCMP2564" /LENGTH=295 /DNA_ID=CAMNT_0021221597 /DNA_START=90 /DNA_END=974 /DNA_ORIENTATION=+
MAGRRPLLVLAVLLASCVASAGAVEVGTPVNPELNAWARHNDDAARPALVLRPKYGLGNRMLSAISALALAVATDRRLFVEWEHPFEDLFISPFPAGWLQPAAELADLATSRRWHRPQTLDLTASSPTFSSIAAGLVCQGASVVLGGAAVVEVSSDQYFLPLLLIHDDSRARLAALLGEADSGHHKVREKSAAWDDGKLESLLVQLIGRWLLQPAPHVRRAVVAFEQQHFAPLVARASMDEPGAARSGACLVGLHVRVPMFDFEMRQVPKIDIAEAVRCAAAIFANDTHTHAHTS